MARKELSPYAPDRWIRELNRRYPCLWADLRKGYADPGKLLHLKRSGLEQLSTVPDWCIMPPSSPFSPWSSDTGNISTCRTWMN